MIPVGPQDLRLHSLTLSLTVSGSGSDHLTAELLELLDQGARTVADLARDLAPRGGDTVRAAVDHLVGAGVLRTVAALEPVEVLPPEERRRLRPQIAFLDHFVAPDPAPGFPEEEAGPGTGAEYQGHLRRVEVVILGLGRIGSGLLRDFALAGVGTLVGVDSAPVWRRTCC